jgi:hypothetical protein
MSNLHDRAALGTQEYARILCRAAMLYLLPIECLIPNSKSTNTPALSSPANAIAFQAKIHT